jgi:hypothetical protein
MMRNPVLTAPHPVKNKLPNRLSGLTIEGDAITLRVLDAAL